jgi:spore germination protein KC
MRKGNFMEKTKRTTVHLLLFLSIQTLLLSGCWDRTEINDLAIITAAGLDITKEHQVELSVKIFTSQTSKGQGMGGMSTSDGGGPGQFAVQSATGVTLADAASKLQQMLPHKVFWGQDEVFVFGERLAKQGLAEPMEFLTRHPAPREHANVFVSKGLAKDVLRLNPPMEQSVADVLREMAKSQTGLNISLKEFAQMMAGKAGAAAVPWVEIKGNQDDQGETPVIHGTAIIKNGKMVGHVNPEVTRGIMWLRNEVKSATVNVRPQGTKGYVSLFLLRSHTKLVPHIEGNNWSVTVKIETEDDIVENSTDLNLMDMKNLPSLESAMRADIEKRVKSALTEAQERLNADIFGFADAFYRKYPKEWNRAKDDWDERYPKVKVKLETKAKVVRPGLTGKNLFQQNQR